MASCSFYLCFINLSLLFGYLLSDPDTYCSQPRCVINPSTPCRVTSTSTIINFQTRCPSGLNPKLPDGGYRDLPGTPTDVKIERIDSTGQPILVISWKHPVPDKSLPPLQSFSVFVQAWDTKDSFKTKCLDRWFTVYSPSPTWPDHRTITLEITCPFFRDKWLFVYINSMFNTSSKCFVRQAHGIYKSSETPAGLPDYRVRLDPYGTEEISIKFNPTPAVEHVVLWCNSTQKAVCSSTDCQRAYLSAGYGMTVFRNVKSCQWYTLKICPQVSLSSRILYVAEVFIPELKAIETRNISQTIVENINDDLIINQQQGVTASNESESSKETIIPWIVVGLVVGVVLLGLIFMTILVFKFRERCHFTKEEIKYSKQHKTSTISNVSSDCPSEILALFTNDATPIPIFYYPDNKEHIDTVNWWAKRIQKNAGEDYNIQTYSIMDPIFNQVMSNVFDKYGLFNMIFIVYSPQVFKMTPQRKLFKNRSPINGLPRQKLQLNVSPIKQIILQKIHQGRNNVCILDVFEEKSDDEVIEMNCLLDFNKVIQLEEGQVQDSVQRVIQELKIHQNQISPKKLTKDDSSEFHDGGYYSGPKCFQSDETDFNRSVISFFPPSEIDDALSETSIMERLEEINERSCAYSDSCRMDSIQIISNGKSLDSLSI